MNEIAAYTHISTQSDYMDRVTEHIPLVKKIAYYMSNRLPKNILLNDLIQSGMIGLIEAAKNYRDDKGCSFETYANIRVRGAILDDIRRQDWIPRSVYKNARTISQAIEKVENRLNREARSDEIAAELNVSVDEYHQMLMDTNSCDLFSLEDVAVDTLNLANSSDDPFVQTQNKNIRSVLANELAKLPEREQLVLSLHMIEEFNFKEIGKILEISESRVCQIHSQAISRLRARIKNIL